MIKRYGLYCAWLVSLIATMGSIYYSALSGYVPCTLCWYQRVAMFPLIAILAIACYRVERNIAIYLYPQIIFGIVVCLYQIIQNLFPSLYFAQLCGPYSCRMSTEGLEAFLPYFALIAFILVGFFLMQARHYHPKK